MTNPIFTSPLVVILSYHIAACFFRDLGLSWSGSGRGHLSSLNVYCNIGTCDLLHPVSFAVPGLAPQYTVLSLLPPSLRHKRQRLPSRPHFPFLSLPSTPLSCTHRRPLSSIPAPTDHCALAFSPTHYPFHFTGDAARDEAQLVLSDEMEQSPCNRIAGMI